MFFELRPFNMQKSDHSSWLDFDEFLKQVAVFFQPTFIGASNEVAVIVSLNSELKKLMATFQSEK